MIDGSVEIGADNRGNYAILITGGGGSGSPGVSAMLGVTYSNLYSIYDTAGKASFVQGTVGEGAAASVQGTYYGNNKAAITLAYGSAAGPSPAGICGGVAGTAVYGINIRAIQSNVSIISKNAISIHDGKIGIDQIFQGTITFWGSYDGTNIHGRIHY